MSYNINTKATTFWNFLKKNTIEIPIIQRDYAQGRLGKENLRKNFLADLKNALDSDKKMKLDFVYGSIENDNLNPLDGQQRLTTLWLLHWYIALRAGELSEDNCKIFRKFTYETRISSREFRQNLCNPKHFDNFDRNDIVGFITKRTWFYSAWKQDPTIQSMLRMLGGTKLADKNGDDIVDGIEEVFQGTNVYGFKSYWEKLTQEKEEVIVFYHLPLIDFGLSDDLYIKMNARGKQLTSFENFKADLIGYITNQAEDESLEKSVSAEWKKLIDPESGIPIKIDTDWTDIFWKNKSKEGKIDEIYFAFINRYFLQELICAKKEDKTYLSVDNLEKENGAFRHLYGEKGDDSRLQYSGFDKYLIHDDKDDKAISLNFFTSLSKTLDNLKLKSGCKFFEGNNCLNTYFPIWVDSKFDFIPKYDETGNITTLGQKERVVFLAVCRYFEKSAFDSISFKRWMRVVWNIVENSGIETIPAMIGAMRLIDELAKHSHDIYKFLSNPQLQVESNFAKEQVAEEIAKAQQIILDKNGALREYNGSCKKADGSDYQTWEEIIIEAEKYAFFKGAIRFLFTDGEGNIDWNKFDTKWANAQKYFDENGVKDEGYSKYKTNVLLLKAVLFHVNDISKIRDEERFVFDNEHNTWKEHILLNTDENWKTAVNKILMGNLEIEERGDDCLMYKNLYNTNLLNYIAENQKSSRIKNRKRLGNHWAIYPYYKDGILLDNDEEDDSIHRNKLLSELISENKVESGQKIKDYPFLKGWDINFKYNKNAESCDFYFQWNRNDYIYLTLEDFSVKIKDSSKSYETERYFCFNTSKIMGKDDLEKKLDKLIQEEKQHKNVK